MGYFIITILIIFSIVGTGWSSSRLDYLTKSSNDDEFNVISYGAVGDGETDDSQAFLKAWEDLCAATSSNPTLVIPSGKTFLLQSVAFHGPCKSPTVHILLSGNLVAPSISAWSGSRVRWIEFRGVDGLILDGSGQIDGQGSGWWSACGSSAPVQELDDVNACSRPSALTFQSCNGLQLSGLKHINSARNHVSISGCNNVTVSDVHVVAPEDSPNTDGFDISHSTQVVIRDSFIGTGDDCVALNNGCSFINITNVACGPGHGISVGSLGKNGANDTVEEVHVRNCNFTRTMNGVRIKTWQGGSGYARKISFDQIRLVDVGNPIIIDQYYCPAHNCKNHTSAVEISDVTYTEVQGTSSTEKVIDLSCSQTIPCKNIEVNHVKIQKSTKRSLKKEKQSTKDVPFAYCYNAQGESTDTSPPVPCLS